MTLITTNTESGDANSAFTSSIDSTYKLYVFKFYGINPETDNAQFTFNVSIDGGSNYNVTKTTTVMETHHDEADSATALAYETSRDIAQGTGYQILSEATGSGGDESCAGEIFLFNPSSTTYVKHFYGICTSYHGADYLWTQYVAGYFNTTDNIDAIDFKMSSGNMDGTIKMYGVG